ncbi:transposable element Tc1 transposase [Trichonephila clavipes]|nr:transposable element Tc1 transposase [Trichonephila clavipes]
MSPHHHRGDVARSMQFVNKYNVMLLDCLCPPFRAPLQTQTNGFESLVWVWHIPGERPLSECIVPTVNLGGGGIMVWGCFSWYGLGALIPIYDKPYVDCYCTFLDNNVLPTLSDHQFARFQECEKQQGTGFSKYVRTEEESISCTLQHVEESGSNGRNVFCDILTR